MDFEMPKRKSLPRLCKASSSSSKSSGSLSFSCSSPHGKNSKVTRKCVCIPQKYEIIEFPRVWNELRLANQLSDGIVTSSDGENIPIHRAILSAVSSYFKVLFTHTFSGKSYEKYRMSIELPANIFKLIMDFAYTGNCSITKENVQELLVAADRYEVLGVVQKCCHFLLNELTPDNCLGIMKFAKHYFCHDLEKQGDKYILHNFKDILLCSNEFIELSVDELHRLLSHDELNIRNEELVFEAVSKWIDHKTAEREEYLPYLSQCVRYGLMAYDFFTKVVVNNKHILKNKAVQESLIPVAHFLAESESKQNGGLDLNLDLARPRIPCEILFAIGGWSAGSPTSFVETYDTRADRWFLSMNTDTIARAYHGICALDNLIYMIGGFDGTDHFNTMRCFNPLTRLWNERACMYHARCYVSVCVLGGLLYAMGGFNGRNRMKSVERYHPKDNQWELVASMNHDRSDGCAATLYGKVYIAGGFNGIEVLNTVEMYDPNSNQWTQVTSMITPRSGVSLVTYRNRIYALGGFNGFTRLQSGEVYDPASSIEWQATSDMYNPRSNFSSVVLDDLLFVIGGFNGSTTIPYVECYDADTDEWFDASSMNLNRSALGACVLSGLHNSKEYSYLSKVEEFGHGTSGNDLMAGGENGQNKS